MLASATTGNAVAAEPAKHNPAISHQSDRSKTWLASQLAAVTPSTAISGPINHNAIAIGLQSRPGTDSRSAAPITSRPATHCNADRPQTPNHPSAAASDRTLKAIGAATSETIANGAIAIALAHGDRSVATGR